MFLNFVIVLALAGAVKSSVIINVFEDGVNKAPHSLRGGCNYRACDQLCRRLGFTGGACVGDKCKCDNFAPVIDFRTGYSQSGAGACDFRACDQLCRRLGFPGGACIGDKCNCDNFATLAGSKDDSTHAGCNRRSCEELCLRHGFPGGSCVGDKCKCHSFEPIIEKGTALDYLLRSGGNAKPSHFLDGCNFKACDRRCRKYGFPGGACIGDKCDCDEFQEENNEDEFINIKDNTKGGTDNSESEEDKKYLINIIENSEAATLPRDCDAFKCSDMCYRMHYFGGICSNGSCECY